MLRDELRLKAGLPISRDGNLNLALRSFERLAAAAIARIGGAFLSTSMLRVAQVCVQLGLSTTLNDRFGQLFEQSSLRQHLTRIGAVFQPFVDQFGSNGHRFPPPLFFF